MKIGKRLIIGNWKMNPQSVGEAKKIFFGIKKKVIGLKRTDVVLCPPTLYLQPLSALSRAKNLFLGAQDMFYESGGAFTGETNVAMVKNAGATYAIVGHSERRALGETDEIVNKKAISSLREEIKTIVCIGEKNRDVEGNYIDFLKNQISLSLSRIPRKFLTNLIIAYEPVWAIGKSDREAMAGRDVHEMTIFIRKTLSDLYGNGDTADVPILYGGSTSPRNTEDIVSLGHVDGLLVGRESLNPNNFGEMLKIVDKLRVK